ncbi:MAG: hypothetical protein A2538_01160 [Candidatus Magasanikbacteria bacterium RIFOXYD2_FULL_41_14]|uniref:2TM domain-containing protein n=1 Tax=Candidatus Magasanikbacteria bacterium RIFOXYD2_FULL_41_14 TaxID=1798709 RepID=A0A1F6PEH4_9BACT|nr:MAG: hypothetical protein A2538_01160 [Candidatus Magasanikbacteria bacterium RIFOXYD2_FULL_41_14]
MPTLEQLESEINEIKTRNQRVETDKAWETSIARKLVVAILTYLVIVIFFYSADLPRPWLNAIVPTSGFLLSTLTLPIFKNWWIKKFKK